ncbi:MAG: diadenylate cyclase CdaA [Anaerofustis sp.]
MIDSLKSLFHDIFSTFTFVSAIDILLTAVLIYYVLKWIKGTQAQQVAKGIVIVLLITQLSDWLGLVTIHYIFKSMITVGLIALVVMFQPELRRALEKLGSTKLNSVFPALTRTEKEIDIYDVIEEIIDSVKELSASKTGALIVFERNIKLNYIAETGIVLDALVNKSLLKNIFYPNTPLHDGAVIIGRDNLRIKAAGCLLPLTQNRNLNKEIGTRHRSAIGMSENSDCLSVVVSEETGVISYAINGKLSRFIDLKTLRSILNETLVEEDVKQKSKGVFKHEKNVER